MEIERVLMSPDMAKELLKTNNKNRRPSEQHIAYLAGQMMGGAWRENGETIIIGANGMLLDGQHRIAAVILSKTSVPMMIVRGVDETTYATIDMGRKRRTSDILTIEGVAHPFEVASCTAALFRMVKKLASTTVVPPIYAPWIEERYPSLAGWADRYVKSKMKTFSGFSAMGTALVYLSDIAERPELAARLFDGVERGVMLDSTDPNLALRNRLLRLRNEGKKRDLPTVWSGICRTVDAMETGEPLERVHFTRHVGELNQPKKMKGHLALRPTMSLSDLAAPPKVPKVRSQADMINRLVNGK